MATNLMWLVPACPFCYTRATQAQAADFDGAHVDCERCGHFVVGRRLVYNLSTASDAEKAIMPFIGTYVRAQNDQWLTPRLDEGNWRELAEAYAHTTVTEQLSRLRRLLASRMLVGGEARYDGTEDSARIGVRGDQEFTALLDYLTEIDHAEVKKQVRFCGLTVRGWQAIESESAGSGIPGRCFVAMSFNPRLVPAFEEGIYQAVKTDCRMEPVLIARAQHNEKICNKIEVEIRRSEFLVADVTRQRQNVYFEAGFAMGLGRPVIWSCQKREVRRLHFDTRQYSHILWETPADLRRQLAERIQATIPSAQARLSGGGMIAAIDARKSTEQ